MEPRVPTLSGQTEKNEGTAPCFLPFATQPPVVSKAWLFLCYTPNLLHTEIEKYRLCLDDVEEAFQVAHFSACYRIVARQTAGLHAARSDIHPHPSAHEVFERRKGLGDLPLHDREDTVA